MRTKVRRKEYKKKMKDHQKYSIFAIFAYLGYKNLYSANYFYETQSCNTIRQYYSSL